MKIIVIGSLAAGMGAARRISGDAGADITVYERGSFYSCGACGLPHFLKAPLDELKAAIRYKEDTMNQEGIHAYLRHEVTHIDAMRHEITVMDLNENRTFTDRYDKLIVATGNRVLIPDVPGAKRIGVQTLKSVEDLLFLKEYTKTPYVRDIVILGGSYSGIEIAKVFLEMGRNVRIIEKEAHLLPDFDPEISDAIRKELEGQGAVINTGENVTEFPGQTFIERVKTNRGTYDCDLCISAIGVVPETGLLHEAGAELYGNTAVLVSDDFETSLKDVYAVGNCTLNRAGSLRTSSLRTHNFEVARTGLTEREAVGAGLRVKSVIRTAFDRPGIVPNPRKVTLKLIYEASSNQLVGAEGYGEKNVSSRINALAVAISAGMKAHDLSKVDFCYSSGSCSIWDPIQVAAEAAV